jgi:general secretion pathway protein M
VTLYDLIFTRLPASAPARWLAGRERNEQWVILGLAALTVITVLWLGIWKPISDWRDVEHNRYRNAQIALDWMRANEARAREIAQSGPAGGGARQITQVITRSAEVQQLQIARLQPEDSGAVSVVLQSQPFNQVVRWLHQLQQNNGVTVARASFDAETEPGLVSAQIRLQ